MLNMIWFFLNRCVDSSCVSVVRCLFVLVVLKLRLVWVWMLGLEAACDPHSWLIWTVHLDHFEVCDAALGDPLTSES